jgi:hypothetical protein
MKTRLKPTEVVRQLKEQYPELSWLTEATDATPEAGFPSSAEGTFGFQLFPNLPKKNLVEFDRTVVGILTLLWTLDGDYESFVACQNGPTKLTPESFAKMRAYTLSVLKTPEDIEALKTFLVINDLSKIRRVIEQITEKTSTHDVDHDKMLLVGLEQAPEISPSFQKLSPLHQARILNGLRTEFNLGQFIQSENVPASLEKLKGIDTKSLNLYLLHALYDIDGAKGQSVQDGSLVMNESAHQGFWLAVTALEELGQGHTPTEVYEAYLAQRAKVFGFDATTPKGRALTRLGCLMRAGDAIQAQAAARAFKGLAKNVRAILVHDLNIRGTDDGIATLIYYAPALLVNLQRSFESRGDQNASEKALTLGFTTLAQLFQEAHILNKRRTGDGICTVMASALAQAAAQNPERLERERIELKAVGPDAEAELIAIPVINASKFPTVQSLAEVSGRRIVAVGIGGGSDGLQAAILADLLKKASKEALGVVSIRAEKTGGQARTAENHGGEISPNVFRMLPETTGSGRFLENIPAGDLPTFLVIERTGVSLASQIDSVLKHLGGADTIIAVDTGGDCLYSTGGQEVTKTTPDQDLRSLQAISELTDIQKMSCVIAVGIDSPPNAEDLLRQAEAKYHEMTSEEATAALAKYRAWGVDGTSETRYGLTPLIWQKALRGEFGLKAADLPTSVVLDRKNPWQPFVHVQPSMRGMFFMEIEKHLAAIGLGK